MERVGVNRMEDEKRRRFHFLLQLLAKMGWDIHSDGDDSKGDDMELQITDENFEQEVLESNIPVLVDFFADWCGPCIMMAPIVADLAKAYDGVVKVGKLDVDKYQELALQYRILNIPTFLLFKDGEVVETIVGASLTKESFQKMVKPYL